MARGEDIVALARKYLGTRYEWGGASPGGFDCSGLIYYIFGKKGIHLPRVTYDQIRVGSKVPINKLRPGDLVFFDTDRSRSGPDHVGVYIGGGKFIHSPRPGKSVQVSSLAESYYQSRWMGGRRVPGVSASAASGGGEAEEIAPVLDAHELAETYGMSYAFFKSQPELFKMLKKAVDGQWTATKFQGELKNSKWWKTHAKSVREVQVLQKTDPATYKATMEAARVQAKELAVKAGAVLSDSKVSELAKNMVVYQWNEAQISNFLGSYVKFQSDHVMGGLAGQVEKEIKKQAYDLGVSVTEQSILNNAQYVVRGLTSMEKISQSMRQQAAGLYPAFAEQIQAGANMSDIAEPYAQVLSQELNIPDTDVNLFTPKIKQALNHTDEHGNPVPMTLSQFTQTVRNDPRWTQTPQATDKTLGIGRQVLGDLGLLR